jgi:hypothetical protein
MENAAVKRVTTYGPTLFSAVVGLVVFGAVKFAVYKLAFAIALFYTWLAYLRFTTPPPGTFKVERRRESKKSGKG